MAREELGHVATLRRERRRAFHDLRQSEMAKAKSIAFQEGRLADALDGLARIVDSVKIVDRIVEVTALRRLARERAAAAQAWPLVGPITTGLARITLKPWTFAT